MYRNKLNKIMSKKTVEQELTDIIVILDRSSSIESYGLTKKNIEGFNSFLKEQKEETGLARMTLALFDGNWYDNGDNNAYELRYNMVDIQNVQDLDAETYIPKGMTALYDGIGITLQNYKNKLEKLPINEKPDKVVVLIMTDGEENASKEFNKKMIAEMIEKHEKEDLWGFVFMGANIDTMGESQSMNISVANTIPYTSNVADTQKLYKKLSKSVTKVRGISKETFGATLNNFAVTKDKDIED